MSKLEEQLRASRHTEVSGLTPPPGGWEAVSGQLANGGAGGAAAAAEAGKGATASVGGTSAGSAAGAAASGLKALVVKWIVGLGAPLLVAGGITAYALTGNAPADTSGTPTEKALSVTPSEIRTEEGLLFTQTQTATPATEQAVTPITTPAKANAPLSPEPRAGQFQKSAPQPATVRQRRVLATERNATTPSAPVKTSPAFPKTTVAEQPASATAGLDVLASPSPEPASGETFSPEDQTIGTELSTPTPKAGAPVKILDGPPSEKTPNTLATTSTITNFTVPALPPRAVSLLRLTPALLSSSFELPPATLPPNLPKFRRNGKPRAPAYWEYHGSLSAYYYQNFNRSAYFERQPDTGPFSFVLPTGETILATTALNLSDATPSIEQGFYLKGGMSRQASSGFLFRLSAGLSFYDVRKDEDNFNLVSDNLIREDQKTVEWSLPVEAGIQYTFLKRHRFRPYLGISMIGTLYHNSVQESTFFDGRTMLSGTSERTVNSFYFGGLRDVGLEAGIQYRLNNTWSVGILSRVSSDLHVYIPAAFGAEVRYSLK